MRKTSGLTALALSLPLALAGCDEVSKKYLEVDGYKAHIEIRGYRVIEIVDPMGGKVRAFDGGDWSGSPADGRFDEIHVSLDEGHPLEKYINLQELERLYEKVNTEGK